MSLAALIDRMIAAGVSPGEAGSIAAEIYAAGVASASVRSPGAERTRRYRERHKASQSVTCDAQSVPSQSVTERHQTSQSDALHSAPLTKEDKKKEESKEKKEARRGTRLPETWVPNEANISYAIGKQLSSVRLEAEGRKFRNYWAAKSGQGATKVNWNLTWENWIDNTIEREGPKNGHGNSFNGARGSSSANLFAGLASLAADIAGDDPTPGLADPSVPLGKFNIDG